MASFEGVIPIIATPFNDDESLDLQSWHRVLEFMIELGVDGVTILGVLGESNRLCDSERETLIASAVQIVNGRVPIIVGTSHTGSEAATCLSKMAEELGANAVMLMPGKEPVPNDDRIVEMYERVGSALEIPIVLQDHPASSDVHFSVPLMLRLLESVPSIRCIKEEAVPTAPKIRQLREGLAGRPFPILTGLGALYAPFDLEAGSNGFNTGFAFPEVLMALMEAARGRDWDLVHDLYARFAPLIVFEQQPGVAVRKEILRRRGLFDSSRARHPGASITKSAAEQLERLLERTLPGVDVTRPIPVRELAPSRGSDERRPAPLG